MTLKTDWPCWEIMKCNPEEAKKCPAYKSEKACWEVMREIDTFSFNICRDCVVFMIKQTDSQLSQEEIRNIMNQKGIDVTVNVKCPQFKPSTLTPPSAEAV